MKLIWEVEPHDVAQLQAFLEQHWNDPLVQRRIALNVNATKQPVVHAEFWQSLVFCLLTTQQRSGPNSPVTRFISTDPFPLAFHICAEQGDIRHFTQTTIRNFGGLRFSNRLAVQIANNFSALQQGLWTMTFDILEQLRQQQTVQAEQRAANFIDTHFHGFGPKQSRNLLQVLRLSQYEIPIDSRITNTIDEDAPVLVELEPRRGVEEVSLSASDLAEKSAQALDNAMNTIRHMAQRVMATIDGLAQHPSQVEVEFGLKLDTEGFALITKVGLEATLNVKLTWDRQKSDE